MSLQGELFRNTAMSRKRGRPPLKKKAMTDAERQKKYRRSKTARGKREAALRARQEADRLTGGSYAVHHVSVNAVTSEMLADDSVDAVITDPPYLERYLPDYSSLAAFAGRVLKPYGWCVVMTGVTYLPEVIMRLTEQLTYRWTICNTWPGGAMKCNVYEGLSQAWKPILVLQKGDGRSLGPRRSCFPQWNMDMIVSKPGEYDKSLHKWQQSEVVFRTLVDRFTVPGGLVADPFAGSGTTGRAAVSAGRHFWGCDIDPDCATAHAFEVAA